MTTSSTDGVSSARVGQVRALRALGFWTVALLAAAVAAQVVQTVAAWWSYRSMAGHHVSGALLVRRERAWLSVYGVTTALMLLAMSAAGVVLLVWLWRARRNSEVLCAARHRLPIGWVIGGWFCPIVNVWFPALIVADVLRASDPRTPSNTRDLRSRPAGALVVSWWLGWLITLSLLWAVRQSSGANAFRASADLDSGRYTSGFSYVAALLTTASTVSAAVTAVCLAALIRRVDHWQQNRARQPRPQRYRSDMPAPAPVPTQAPPAPVSSPAIPAAGEASVPRAEAGSRGRHGVLLAAIIVVAGVGAVVIGVALAAALETGPQPSTSAPTSTATQARPTPVMATQTRQRIADMFPGLAPVDADALHGNGLGCSASVSDGIDTVHCSPQRLTAGALRYSLSCNSTPTVYREKYPFQSDARYFRRESFQRPSGTGYLRISTSDRDEGAGLYVYFDEMPRAACGLMVSWIGHNGADILNQWWPTAPL